MSRNHWAASTSTAKAKIQMLPFQMAIATSTGANHELNGQSLGSGMAERYAPTRGKVKRGV